jgi:hypothetical protein
MRTHGLPACDVRCSASLAKKPKKAHSMLISVAPL